MEFDQSQPSTQASQGQKTSKLTKAEMERKVSTCMGKILLQWLALHTIKVVVGPLYCTRSPSTLEVKKMKLHVGR